MIKDPLRGGHNRNNPSTKDMIHGLKCIVNTFEHLKSKQPLYKGQNGWPCPFSGYTVLPIQDG